MTNKMMPLYSFRNCLPLIFLMGFVSVILFPMPAKAAGGGQEIANKIASLTSRSIYNFDTDQLSAFLKSSLDEKPKIQALIVTESIDHEVLFKFYRQNNKAFYNQPIPEDILKLKSFSAVSKFNGEDVGVITIYYNDTEKIKLSNEEQSWIQKHPTITVGILEWFPFVRANEDGTVGGIVGDFVSLVMKKTGLKISIASDTWNESLQGLKDRKIDLLPATYFTKERTNYGLYSGPYFTANEFIYVKQENSNIHSFADLKGKKLAIEKGFGTIPKIRKRFPSITIVETKNTLASMYAVLNGDVDALFESQVVIENLIREKLIRGLKGIAQTDFSASKLYFFSRIDEPVLHSILSKALNDISDIEKRKIINKWVASIDSQNNSVFLPPKPVKINQTSFIIQYIAMIFGFIVVVIIIVWFARGRPKQLTIRETLFLIFFIFSGLIVSIGTFVSMLLDGEQQQSKIESRKYASLNLALELKQSSDDLTRFARMFAVTGNPKYKEYYQTIIDIRDGKKAHPKNYTRSYWDHVVAGSIKIDEKGETYSIQQKMKDLGFSEAEQKKISESKKQSNVLVNLEQIAMNAVQGTYSETASQYMMKPKPNLKTAQKILNGKEYLQAKAKIMQPIDDFFVLLKWRTTNELNQIRDRNQAIILGITVLVIMTIGFAIYAFFVFKRRIISPLYVLETGAEVIKNGDYSHHIDITTKDEIGSLSNAFNAMALGIQERNAELQNTFDVISDSINYASRIQRSMLPSDSILSAVTQDHFILWKPRDTVGGDMYWHGSWGDGCLIILGDCTGHGVPGAFMTLIVLGALERATSEIEGGRVGALVSRVHQYIQVSLGQHYKGGDSDDGIELGACYFVPDEPVLTFVGARFELMVCDGQKIQTIKGTKKGMGYRGIPYDQTYEEKTVTIKYGQSYYMTTDGFIDQVGGERRRMFGKKRFKDLLMKIQDLPMPEQEQELYKALLKYQGTEKRRDDIAIIGFKI